jgi:hypothetical protein
MFEQIFFYLKNNSKLINMRAKSFTYYILLIRMTNEFRQPLEML